MLRALSGILVRHALRYEMKAALAHHLTRTRNLPIHAKRGCKHQCARNEKSHRTGYSPRTSYLDHAD